MTPSEPPGEGILAVQWIVAVNLLALLVLAGFLLVNYL